MSDSLGAILVAAGSSRRMGFDKLWAPLAGRPVVSHALAVLAACSQIDRLALVVAADRLCDAEQLIRDLGVPAEICVGGARRRDSVAAGLRSLGCGRWVLVHDAARPFLTDHLIRDGLEAARDADADAAVAAVPVRDTVKRVSEGLVLETLPRDQLWNAQTPQLFRLEILDRALRTFDEDATDEAALVERLGGRVVVYPGAESNRKLTTPADLELAEAWLALGAGSSAGACQAVG